MIEGKIRERSPDAVSSPVVHQPIRGYGAALAAGIGFRYKSLVGPLRVDLGFKLGALQQFGAYREQRTAFHISIGQAF